MPSLNRHPGDDWTADAPKINSQEQLECVRLELEKGAILLKHWHYRGACGPTLLVFENYDKYVEYLDSKAQPGDAFDAWPLKDLFVGLGTLAAGKYPDDDGTMPRKGAY